MVESILSLTGVSYSYPGNIPALSGIDLSVNASDRVAIIGANGTGKSTLLTMLDALIFPDTGTVNFSGQPVTRHAMDDALTQRAFRARSGSCSRTPTFSSFALPSRKT